MWHGRSGSRRRGARDGRCAIDRRLSGSLGHRKLGIAQALVFAGELDRAALDHAELLGMGTLALPMAEGGDVRVSFSVGWPFGVRVGQCGQGSPHGFTKTIAVPTGLDQPLTGLILLLRGLCHPKGGPSCCLVLGYTPEWLLVGVIGRGWRLRGRLDRKALPRLSRSSNRIGPGEGVDFSP